MATTLVRVSRCHTVVAPDVRVCPGTASSGGTRFPNRSHGGQIKGDYIYTAPEVRGQDVCRSDLGHNAVKSSDALGPYTCASNG
ncbi:hypothetical protein EYF80_051816 [Liparis tanakae]|uniref:Uncharacterized protein n=1 Tax=Liparis tanakae TaxID=230148 RepID=A0A4Z2FAV0_9TELE|nr:hypothetical protein EYF80_051816 [Liparis tanakae]